MHPSPLVLIRCSAGPTRVISASERCLVIATACEDPQTHGLAGHSSWSAALLAQLLTLSGRITRISTRSVQRMFQIAAIKPHRCAYWKQPIDPNFDATMRPVIDLYLNLQLMARLSAPTRRPASRPSSAGSRICPRAVPDNCAGARWSTSATALVA